MLGDSQVTVELVKSDWDILHPYVLSMYTKHRPLFQRVPLTTVVNKQDYILPIEKVGLGVYDVYFEDNSVDGAPRIFGEKYEPLAVGGMVPDATHYLQAKQNLRDTKDIYGTLEDWDYNEDTNVLTIYPIPSVSTKLVVQTMHARRFDTVRIGKFDASSPSYVYKYKDEEGFNLHFMTTGVTLLFGDEKFRYLGDNQFKSTEDNTAVFNPTTSEITFTFDTAPTKDCDISYSACEISKQDYAWYQNYSLAVAKTIVGYKRRRFGNVPGQQGPIDLDVAIKEDGTEDLRELTEQAKLWQYSHAIPRKM